jgi:hypothetical protein
MFNKYTEKAHDLIEVFEQFLEDRGIIIENKEKGENEDASNIYGEDYYSLEDKLIEILKEE